MAYDTAHKENGRQCRPGTTQARTTTPTLPAANNRFALQTPCSQRNAIQLSQPCLPYSLPAHRTPCLRVRQSEICRDEDCCRRSAARDAAKREGGSGRGKVAGRSGEGIPMSLVGKGRHGRCVCVCGGVGVVGRKEETCVGEGGSCPAVLFQVFVLCCGEVVVVVMGWGMGGCEGVHR